MSSSKISWKQAVAVKLALCLQAKYRGMKSRENSRKLRAIFIIKAIKTIQRAYRKWKLVRFTKKSTYVLKANKPIIGNNFKIPWDEIKNGRGDYKDRISLWRAIIEIRRAHPHFCTDVCLRALILAQGNLQRAMVIVSNPEFHLSAQASLDLSFEQRFIFLPFVDPVILNGNSKYDNKGEFNLRIYRYIQQTYDIQSGGRGLSAVMKKIIDKNEKLRQEMNLKYLATDYSDALYQSFFSLQYAGHDRPKAMRLKKSAPKAFNETAAATAAAANTFQTTTTQLFNQNINNTNNNTTTLDFSYDDNPILSRFSLDQEVNDDNSVIKNTISTKSLKFRPMSAGVRNSV